MKGERKWYFNAQTLVLKFSGEHIKSPGALNIKGHKNTDRKY